MSEPLSKKLGFNKQPISTGSTYQELRNIGYNRCLNDLDQLSPDEDKLIEFMNPYIHGYACDIDMKGLAQEIINQMPLWIKKG